MDEIGSTRDMDEIGSTRDMDDIVMKERVVSAACICNRVNGCSQLNWACDWGGNVI